MAFDWEKLIQIRLKVSDNESLTHEESLLWAEWRASPGGQWARNFTAEDVHRYLEVRRRCYTWEELKAKMGITFTPPSEL